MGVSLRRLTRCAAATVAAAACVLAAGAAHAATPSVDLPQVKIDSATLWDGTLRVEITALDELGRPLGVDAIDTLEVLHAPTGRAQPLVTLKAGKVQGGVEATAGPRVEVGGAAALVVVAPAYLRSSLTEKLNDLEYLATLDRRMREGIATHLLGSLGPADLGNVVWAGRAPAIHIPTRAGRAGLESVDRGERYGECRRARNAAAADRVEPALQPDHVAGLGAWACAPGADLEGLAQALAIPPHVAGDDPAVFGTALAPGGNALAAVPLALQMALLAPNVRERIVVLVSDGRDGPLEPEATAAAACPAGPDNAACRTRAMRERIDRQQEAFARVAAPWLDLCEAAGIRIHGIGIHSDRAVDRRFELDRVRVLALGSGGTYREARDADALDLALARLGAEIAQQWVVEVPYTLAPGARLSPGVRVVPKRGGPLEAAADPWPQPPEVPAGGASARVLAAYGALEGRVGRRAALAAVVIAGVLLLVALRKPVVKLVAGGAKGLVAGARKVAGV